jgi:PAS domain S-box-containing protein
MTATLKASLDDVERHRSYLENVINSIEDEIVVVDRSFRVVTTNEAYLKNHESTKDGLVGRSCCAGCNGSQCDMASREECPARNTFETGNVEKRLCRFHDPTGRERFIEIYSYPLTDAGGRVFQAIEVRRDITERRFLEANLCHADRLASLGLLASGFSHEINNPLASIVTCSEGLHKRMIRKAGNGSPDTQEILDYLGVISKEAMRAKAITERLLILARRSPSVTYLVSVNRSLAETVLLIRFQAESKQVRIVEQYDPALPEIKGDDPGLRQVFLNLLLNALQATEPGGRVTVWTEMAADTLRVSIEDTGRGIPAEDLPRLFEPFFSRRPTGEGSGLGLFISNTLVRQMGGYLEVSSLPGEGSCFTLTLPVTGRLTACPDRPESALDVV